MATTKKTHPAKAGKRAQSDKAAQGKDKKNLKGGLDGGGVVEGSGRIQISQAVVTKVATKRRPKAALSAKQLAKQNASRAQEAKELEEWIETGMTSVDEYESVDQDTQAQLYDGIVAIEKYLYSKECLFNPDRFLQRVAVLVYFRHQLARTFSDHDACRDMFDWMVRQRVLDLVSPDPHADLPGGMVKFAGGKKPATIYGVSYYFPEGLPLVRKDILGFRKLCHGLRERTQAAVRKNRQERAKELEGQVTGTAADAMAGKKVKFVLDVQPHTEPDKKRSGKMFTHQGGRMLIEFAGSQLFVRDVVNEVGNGGMGVFEAAVCKIMDRQPKLVAKDIFAGKSNGLLSGMVVRGLRSAGLLPEPEEPTTKAKKVVKKTVKKATKAKKKDAEATAVA